MMLTRLALLAVAMVALTCHAEATRGGRGGKGGGAYRGLSSGEGAEGGFDLQERSMKDIKSLSENYLKTISYLLKGAGGSWGK